MEPTIITISAIKGGSGKSTLAWALGTYLAQYGRTLLWDNDAQGTLSNALASEFMAGAFEVLTASCTAREAIVPVLPQYGASLSIVGASSRLAELESATAALLDRQYLVADALAGLDGFDFIVIDTPAGQGIATTTALVAASMVISPVPCQPAALETLPLMEQLLTTVRRRLNPGLRWFVSPALFDQRQVLDREVLAAIRQQCGRSLIEPIVRRRVALAEDMANQRPCSSTDYENLTINLIERINSHDQEVHPPSRAKGGYASRR